MGAARGWLQVDHGSLPYGAAWEEGNLCGSGMGGTATSCLYYSPRAVSKSQGAFQFSVFEALSNNYMYLFALLIED